MTFENEQQALSSHASTEMNLTNSKQNNRPSKISSNEFYGEYHGHKVKHLKVLLPHLRSSSDSLIWTAGDSSLDNKYW